MKMKASLIIIFLFYGTHLYLGAKTISQLSPTYDEPVHVTAGYVYLKTQVYKYNGLDHPPFGEMWAALPLLVLKPVIPIDHTLWRAQRWEAPQQYEFADEFFYKNTSSWKSLLQASRGMQLFLSLLFGVFLTFYAFKMGGWAAAVIATGFWAVSPTFLAHGTLVTTDLAFAVFFFVFLCLVGHINSWKQAVPAGIALGLMVGSKFFWIILFPCFAALFVWAWLVDRISLSIIRKNAKLYLLTALIGFAVLVLLYQGTKLSLFERGLRYSIKRAQSGQPSFFLGDFGQGWLFYFPFTFLAKSSIPFLVGVVIAAIAALKGRFKLPARLVIPPLIFFILICFSNKQIGHRYILWLYPFVFLALGVGLSKLKGKARLVPAVLLLFAMVEAWRVNPNYLSYFNQLAGGPSRGYLYLTDSNVDWGQGIKLLSDQLTDEDKANGIYYSCFGVTDPHSYGIRYVNLEPVRFPTHTDDGSSSSVNPTKLAISATNLISNRGAGSSKWDWLNDYKPVKQIANSIFLYDFANQPEALKKCKDQRKEIPNS